MVGRDRELPRFATLAQALKIARARQLRRRGGRRAAALRRGRRAGLPTLYDPFPNVVLEALAMGLPAIVSDQCGAAERW